jgi:protein-L-isoaspartate(D-aspartate) O-methyltransferase
MTRPQTGLQHMLSDIDQLLAQYAAATGVGALSPRIRAALRATPRDRFTPEPVKPLAYADRPQPIGYGQTMSQPFMVALMSELLEPESSDNILEIGTGSGCQAAILANLCATLYSLEVIPELAKRASTLLANMGYHNLQVISGNGAEGHPAAAPCDKIIITAAANKVPAPLLEQLRPGGLIIAPLGPVAGPQRLTVLRKSTGGDISSEANIAVNFVPFRHWP